MKYRPIVGAALASAPLILSGTAAADFVGLTTVKKPVEGFEKLVALVVNLYAVFIEVFVVAPFLLLVLWVNQRRKNAISGR